MAAKGKNIHLFLMDGDPNGRIKCTISNWIGAAYKIPRIELDKCNNKEHEQLSQSGVYFLFGISPQTNENAVYIGQAAIRKNGEGILGRLREHKRNPDKNYWTEAVVFTTSNNSFGPSEISYLEDRFTNMALAAKRYAIKNANMSYAKITEEKESELEEFIDYAKIVMRTFGYKVFEPLLESIAPAPPEVSRTKSDRPTFFIKRSGANAKGCLTSKGFVVLSGSVIRKDTVPSCSDYVRKLRKDNKKYIDSNSVLQKDVLFETPSGASAFVLGAPTNGNQEWKTKSGKTLKEVK